MKPIWLREKHLENTYPSVRRFGDIAPVSDGLMSAEREQNENS